MLDRTGTLLITKQDIEKFETELKVYSKDLRRVVLAEPPSADIAFTKSRAKNSGMVRNARGKSENARLEKSPGSSGMTKSSVSADVANPIFLRRKGSEIFNMRKDSFHQNRQLNQDLSGDNENFSDIDTSFEEVEFK